MGIETNFGQYLGKMDIVSSLATLSYDKRRSEFFTKELLGLLDLIDRDKIDQNILYGSWAGAFGNFQFMPTTINNYAIDFNSNSIIELKEIEDSFASAANYLNQIGWKIGLPCIYKDNLKKDVPLRVLGLSDGKITSMKKLKNQRAGIRRNLTRITNNIDKLYKKYRGNVPWETEVINIFGDVPESINENVKEPVNYKSL